MREFGGLHRRQHHALADDVVRFLAEVAVGVLLHLRHDQLLVEGAAVDADADGLAVVDRDLADGGELFVAPLAGADVAGIDPVLVERPRAVGIARQQQVAVVVKVADQRRRAAGVEHALLDLGHRGRRLGHVDGDPHHLRAGLPQLDALLRRALGIGRVGHGHRLHDHGGAAAHHDVADLHADGSMPLLNREHSQITKSPNHEIARSRLAQSSAQPSSISDCSNLLRAEQREVHRVVVLDPVHFVVGEEGQGMRRTAGQDHRAGVPAPSPGRVAQAA